MAPQASLFQILDVVETYAAAMNVGDADALRQAFHPEAQIIGRFEGKMEWDGLDSFVAACVDGAGPEGDPTPPHEIHGVEVAGDTAVVRVAVIWGGLNFFDTLSLVRTDRRWQIVTRVFTYLG